MLKNSVHTFTVHTFREGCTVGVGPVQSLMFTASKSVCKSRISSNRLARKRRSINEVLNGVVLFARFVSLSFFPWGSRAFCSQSIFYPTNECSRSTQTKASYSGKRCENDDLRHISWRQRIFSSPVTISDYVEFE